ncbi:MAG: hypothetical protein M0R06_21320 [Sphaerochaeta sp.]|nr:hypothetical protein [Sphaerochaeta sp.]
MGHHLLYEGVDFPAGIATTSGDCEDIAEAAVRRAASQTETGSIFLPVYNCLQELYDLVTVDDNRGNTSGSGRVGGIFFHYPPVANRLPGGGIEKHTMELRLGGVVRNIATDMPSLVDQMQIELLNRGGLSGAVLKAHSIPPGALTNAMQPYVSDIAWTSTGVANATWAAGKVYFADGSYQTIDAGSKADLTGTHIAYFIEGSDTVQWTTDWTDTVGINKGMLAMCVKGDASSTKALIKVFNGKQDVINALILYADLILGTHIKGGEIDTDHLAAESITTAKLDALAVTAEKIAASAVTTTKLDALAVTAEKIAAEAVTAAKIAAKAVQFSHLAGIAWNHIDNYSFETNDLTNWPTVAGTDEWFTTTIPRDSSAGSYCAGCNAGTDQRERGTEWYRCIAGQTYHLTGYIRSDDGDATGGARLHIVFRDKAGTFISPTYASDWIAATVNYTAAPVTATAPATAAYVQAYMVVGLDASPEGIWYFDDVQLTVASQIIVHGTPGSTRIQIDGTEIAGYNGGTKQFYLSASDGKAYAGAGKLIIDSSGVIVDGSGLFKFYDGSGNPVAYMQGSATQLSISMALGCRLGLPGDILVAGLPTSDPGVEGLLWNSSGVVKVSAG